MAISKPTSAPADPGELLDYKPLSLWAVFGLLLAAIYAALMLIGAVAAIVKGEPFFLGDWTFAVAIAGAVLSALGLWHIYRSEGTRAGALLARLGLGISLVMGIGYFTYQTFTGLAIVQQANSFLTDKETGFFSRLQGSDIDANIAFQQALNVADRGVRPDSPSEMAKFDNAVGQNPKGMLTQFLESPIVKAVRQAAPGSVKLEPLAVRSWVYENGAYSIVRPYRISTDEAVYEVKMTVTSIEPLGEGEQRRWRVEMQDLMAPPPPISRTALGDKRQALRQQAYEFLGDPKTGWLTKLMLRRDFETYLAMKPRALRPLLVANAEVANNRALLVAAAGIAVPPPGAKGRSKWLAALLPDYRPISADIFRMDRVRISDPTFLPKVLDAVKLLLSERLPLFGLRLVPDDLAPCQVHNGEVLVTVQAQTSIADVAGLPKDGVLLLFKLVAAAPENIDPLAAGADQQWYLKSAELVRAIPIPPRQPGT